MTALFSSPKMPTPTAPVVMPTENSTAVAQSQQEAIAAAAARGGRASTILSQSDTGKSDTMGG